MDDKDIELTLRKMMAEDITQHREYLTQQFKYLTWGVGILFTVAAGLFTFLLGQSFDETENLVIQKIDDKVFEYRIAKDLKEKVNQHVAIAVANNVESEETSAQLEKLLSDKTTSVAKNMEEEIQKTVSSAVASELDKNILAVMETVQTELNNKDANFDELINKYIFPVGAVMAFESTVCPLGWEEYSPAYGRVIRGIDKSGKSIDSDGERSPGNLQGDTFAAHHHTIKLEGASGNNAFINRSPAWSYDDWHGSENSADTSQDGSSETRSKNVALLYCKKE